ncbi:hypothetical protein NQ317_015279 [Molorchus minor]|uniref:FCH domain-containing protein n=1 Tax=Molorchus minor TaxID=1323400 RepID=A0ABQ9IZI3_9CUCU|nr:hypothetical protein NQ317_015279 [Molorchus minor]
MTNAKRDLSDNNAQTAFPLPITYQNKDVAWQFGFLAHRARAAASQPAVGSSIINSRGVGSSGSGGVRVVNESSCPFSEKMQPPPRKINKLLLRNQHECDLLEDIRTFIIKRSAIEKSYSEALLKISSAYLNKKIPNIPDIKLDGGEEKWNMWNVWRTVLEENEKLARARLAAVEVFQQQIADDAKILRAHKLQTAKKVCGPAGDRAKGTPNLCTGC